jgi:hypothetical protein
MTRKKMGLWLAASIKRKTANFTIGPSMIVFDRAVWANSYVARGTGTAASKGSLLCSNLIEDLWRYVVVC